MKGLENFSSLFIKNELTLLWLNELMFSSLVWLLFSASLVSDGDSPVSVVSLLFI